MSDRGSDDRERSSLIHYPDLSLEEGDSWTSLKALPPMPEPELCDMRMEASCGITLVLVLITLFVGLTQVTALSATSTAAYIFLTLIYGEACVAITCLLGLMWGDPGTVKRSPETCFPLPEVVLEKLRAGESLDSLGANIVEEDRTFCVRCLVWRPEVGATHHCSTCQRCVRDFDHHCGVFGRCIAGEGFAGNMGYFKVLISMAVAGCATCVGFLMFSAQSVERARPYRPSPVGYHAG